MVWVVVRLFVLSEFCLFLVKKNGLFVVLKVVLVEEELNVGKKVIMMFGGEFENIYFFKLFIEESDCNIMVIWKIKNIFKKYLRKLGIFNKLLIEG